MIIHVASYGVRFATRFQIVQMDQTNLLVHAQPQRDPVLNRRTFVATMVTITMAIRDCGVFIRGYKLERFLPKNQHTQRKLLDFENWFNGEVSKIGHHLRE